MPAVNAPPSSTEQLLAWFAKFPLALRSRWYDDIQHQLRENGANFDRWQKPGRKLDLYPWLISTADWQQMQAGIAQRHQLLALILQDLYGPQQLVQSGIIPAELLFSNPQFLFESAGLVQQPEQWLPLLATDLGFDHHGQVCAFADSCKAPAGLGFALEHRLALKQSIPELQQLRAKAHLSGFFRQLRFFLQQQGNGIAAILTHGARDEAYFEQAFLANYLDLALVHGADLMFSEQRIWLKTLSGLQPVSALMRFLDDRLTDPLELDSEGAGVAGLLHSIRQQQLFCANPPGTALLDSGILLPFLTAAADYFWQKPLLLNTVQAYWCKETQPLQQVLKNPEQFLLHDLSAQQQYAADNTCALLQRPADFIARQKLSLHMQPCYDQQNPTWQLPAVLRTFSLYQSNHPPLLLPGGFARLGELSQIQLPVIAQDGSELSKDVWVLGMDQPTESLLQPSYNSMPLSREAGLLPSRVAEHLFWLGRYNERLNLLIRALRVALPLLPPTQATQTEQQLYCFIDFCLLANGSPPRKVNEPISVALAQLFSPSNPLSVIGLLKNLIYNAQSVREYFSEDTWLLLDKLQATVYQWPQTPDLQQPMTIIYLLDEMVLLQTAIYGLNNETMSRTQALRFMDIGQHLERALQTSLLLQRIYSQDLPSAGVMEALLRMADTLMTYRRRYRSELNPMAILDLLLLDTTTPRSVGYQISRLHRQTRALPELTSADRQHLPVLTTELSQLLEQVSTQQLDANYPSCLTLHAQLGQLQYLLRQLSNELSLCYFTHAHRSSPWSMS
ncbi:circularly permuted type 2 ATP-grasp protein [Alishewanella sp. HL-SH05]|uniref:circularly permuted type 2 ATP-grasp protein n=1 Tax=Alishewanella sp. HL-SH05 TaxID=3461145 RepID=UPI0040427133